jgi:hypothetical protein
MGGRGGDEVREAEFRAWLIQQGYATQTIGSDIARMRRVEAAMADYGLAYRDLDAGFDADRLEAILGAMRRSIADLPGTPPPLSLVPRSTNYEERLNTAIRCVEGYRAFRSRQAGELGDADRIRRHALEQYFTPARLRGDAQVRIRSRDVNEALGLKGHWRNIWQALKGLRLQHMAGVPAPRQIGADESSATEFVFTLASQSQNWAEEELRRRYGDPISDTDKMIAFALPDGRQVALQRDVSGTQVWVEPGMPERLPPVGTARVYEAGQPRHSNLPPRLRHTPPTNGVARGAIMVRLSDRHALRALLDWYEGAAPELDRAVLERLRAIFLEKHPAFVTFTDNGTFGAAEDNYKRALIARAGTVMTTATGRSETGAALLDLIQGKAGLESNLLDWRTSKLLDAIREAHPGRMETAAGSMVAAADGVPAVAALTDELWTLLPPDLPSNPYAESRCIPSMVRALVDPEQMLPIRSRPTDNASKMLLGRWAFEGNPLTEAELLGVIALARQIFAVMREEWHWAPRDLWDVQGFLWETCQKRLDASSDAPTSDGESQFTKDTAMPKPTNLILYGPPGTGKTYATALEAVKLCDGLSNDQARHSYPDTSAGRAVLMQRYRELRDGDRIEFVTFHQSYSYEDFVERLMPKNGEDSSAQAGFSLKPEAGVFRRIAERAETPPVHAGSEAIDLAKVPIYKMSLGEAANPAFEYVFTDSIANGYALFGFETLDWSDPKYADSGEILAALQRESPADNYTAASGAVSLTDVFRNQLQIGDMLVVSKGNKTFRAIGVVEGEYEYVPKADGHYSHRRKVRWLWRDPNGRDVSEIYDTNFTMRTIYRMKDGELKRAAIARLIGEASGEPQEERTPLPHVIIIDEINRANISKVFGELISLIEPDKRTWPGNVNALTATLPYSRKSFGVPANLHIIGTMNTADRSIALLDTALRRRFDFREIAPDPNLLGTDVAGVNLRQVLTTINQRIEYLVDREHRIGHAFFIGCDTREAIDAAMRNKVIPLLQEYFFEDWSRVHAVLGDEFIGSQSLQPPPGFHDVATSWFVRPAFAETAYDRLGGKSVLETPVPPLDQAPAGIDPA